MSRVTLLALSCLLATTARAQLADRPLGIDARIPKPPTVATGSTGSFLLYEVWVDNLEARDLRWTRLEVSDPSGTALLTLADSALARDLARPGQGNAIVDKLRLGPQQRAVLFLRVTRPALPAVLHHRLTFTDSLGERSVSLRPVPVDHAVAVIGPPLRGGPWFAANGPGNTSGHRRAQIPVDGSPAIAQRFAIDYVMFDTAFRTRRGDAADNANYYAEDADAIAVADGVVASVKDSIPENVPGVNSRAVPITLETVGGNFVILDIGNGRFAFYAHLRPGSVRVKTGDRVRRGAVLGKVGNSGNSTEPHLHFHLADRNSPLGAEGIPYVHDTLERVGSCRTFGVGCAFTSPATLRRVLPLENEIVRFPR